MVAWSNKKQHKGAISIQALKAGVERRGVEGKEEERLLAFWEEDLEGVGKDSWRQPAADGGGGPKNPRHIAHLLGGDCLVKQRHILRQI